ncbi:MAG: hypothetical protein LBM13_02545 [Candidatus Ancillula sp.]|jgi:hypothetical protein|nr:hypothetical protein [Candidatus Ancillula sp.]
MKIIRGNHDSSQMGLVIDELVRRHNWGYFDAIDKFYSSKEIDLVSDHETGEWTLAPRVIADEFDEERLENGK